MALGLLHYTISYIHATLIPFGSVLLYLSKWQLWSTTPFSHPHWSCVISWYPNSYSINQHWTTPICAKKGGPPTEWRWSGVEPFGDRHPGASSDCLITLEIHQRIIDFNSLYSLAGVFPRCNLDSESCCLSPLTQTFRISGGCDQRRCSGCSEVFQDDWGLGYSLLDAMVGIHRHVPPMMTAFTWQMQWVSSSTVFGLSENDAPRWVTFHKDSRHLKTSQEVLPTLG